MADPENLCRWLLRLSRAAHLADDLTALFPEAAATLHELSGCDRVSLFVAPAQPAGGATWVMDFTASPPRVETTAAAGGVPAQQWVRTQRQARLWRRQEANAPAVEPGLWEQGYQAVLYLPLVCRGEVAGVLGLASRRPDQPATSDRFVLEEVAGLLALALDNLATHALVTDLRRLQQENTYLRDERKTDRDLRLLTGDSPAMKAVRLAIQQVAGTDSTVLILGETGTGKELVARAIHQLSPRRDHLLVSVNCAALAPGLLASELFGHEPGAFTGAMRRRIGRFELAHRGTLFLDEIGELPLEVQVILLRVLQERVLERVGGTESIAVDVRVVAATHQDLTAARGQGRFRDDLFFRLNVFPIPVPPLRERREDIPDLVRHFLHHFGRRMGKAISEVSPTTLAQLTAYHWPGNVRELENLVERALIVSSGNTLAVDPRWLGQAPPSVPPASAPVGLVEMERQAILAALERCHGRIYGPGGAAALLGVKPTTLYGKMRKHHIAKRPVSGESPTIGG